MRRCLTMMILLTGFCLTAQGLNAADEISGELVGLNVSLAAEKQLVVHDQLVAAEEWVAALDLLDRLKVDGGDVLVKVALGRFVGLPVAIQQRLCRLPIAGLEVYRRRGNSGAAALLNRARTERDVSALWRIVEESSASSSAPIAITDLATQAAGRGDLELGLRMWGRLQGDQPRESRVFPPPLISLRLADAGMARTTLMKIVVARHLCRAPLTAPEMATLGGDDVSRWQLAGLPVRDLLAVSDTRPQSASLGAIRWTTLATSNCPLPEQQTPLSMTPGRTGLVMLNNGQQIRALHVETGEPFWSSGLPQDVGVVSEDALLGEDPQPELPCRIAGGASTRDRHFGVIGDAPRWRPRPGLVPLSGSLVALDTDQGQGRVLWRIESRDLPERDWQFQGDPALSPGSWPNADLVVVPICRPAPQVELAVAAFSQDDGHLVWWTRIGTCAAEAGQPLPSTQLLARGGLVIARTLAGVVVALDARRGQVQWATTALVASPPAHSRSHAPLLDCRAGVIVVADPIAPQAAGLSLDSGEILWQSRFPFPLQGVVCAPGGQVLIAGTRLRAVSLFTGIPLWEHGSDDPAGAGTGVPLVAGQTVLWPTRSGIWGIDLAQGTIEFQRVLFAGPETGSMQLTQTDTHWLLSRPDAILCFKKHSPDQASAVP